MKKIVLLTAVGLMGLITNINAQSKKDSTEVTELKIGKQKILVVEENGNKTSIVITPDANYEEILKNLFVITDSIADAIEKAIDTADGDTVEVKVFPIYDDTIPISMKQAKDSSENFADTVEINIGKIKFVTIDSNEKTSVRIYKDDKKIKYKTTPIPKKQIRNKDTSIVKKDGDKKQKSHRKNKDSKDFEGKWFGVEVGINALYTDNSFYMPTGYNKLDLNYGKSWFFNLNLFQKSIAITDNAGLVTGLGLEFRNYRFINRNLILAQEDTLSYSIDTQYNYVKSKLQTTHLRVPLFFEINLPEKNDFHIMVGVIGNLMLGAHTKNVYYNENNNKEIEKHYNIRYLSFLNYSLSARIGMEDISLFIDYGMLPIFNPDNHLDTHPVNIGVCFMF